MPYFRDCGFFSQFPDRIAGATSEIKALKDAYNKGLSPILPTTDIHAIADLLKSWFRLLPEQFIPPKQYRQILEAIRA